jgi:coniferyl-aldehyde dehydrogenase
MVAEVSSLHGEQAEIERMQRIFEAQRAAFRRHPYPAAVERIDHIQRLKPALIRHLDAITAALNDDFGHRSEDETKLAEIVTSLEGIKYYANNVRRWMKPEKRKVGAAQFPGTAWVEYQPVGVVGIIVPWNYPIYLAIGPMLGALAAGNRVMIKMSEFTPRAGELLQKILGEIFEEDHVAVINGELQVAQAFSSLPFDHLLFTGSTQVGKHIMRAAAENLTPVTLELGGKSPAIIGRDFPLKDACERLAFGKCLNTGQTCVAPDYVLCPSERVEAFIHAWQSQISEMYPSIRDNPDYTSIINERQYKRLKDYLQDAEEKGARIIAINPADEDLSDSRKMPHTLVLNVTDDMRIANEEIFGPLLMVVPYDSLDDAINYVNDRPRPLALYYFDWNDERCQRVLHETHSGGVCLNDSVTQVGVDDLPFGGSGDSGMGHYHGYEGFLTFTKPKGVYKKGRMNPAKKVLPPFGGKMMDVMYKLLLK